MLYIISSVRLEGGATNADKVIFWRVVKAVYLLCRKRTVYCK